MSTQAETLIYTNVEVEQSPTKQRGFQVWQTSAGLSAALKKEITRRVDDYVLPIGTMVETAAEFFVRHSFFPLSDGSLAIAQTSPLKEPDKFKRGGRFFAHVIVIPKEDFVAARSDPFAWFAGAKFFVHPSQIEDPLKGILPPLNITPETMPPTATIPATLMSTIIGHLDRETAKQKTIVLVGKPTEVFRKFGPMYQLLPPQLRGSYAFDSFSLGAGLTHAPCAFVGCPTAEALRMWAYRRFVKLDIETSTFTPAADTATRPIYLKLTTSEHWPTTTDEVRQAAWQAVELLEQKRFADLLTLLAEVPAADAMVSTLPDYHQAIEQAKQSWLAACPPLLLDDAHVRDVLNEKLKGTEREILHTIQQPLPHRELAEALATSIEAGRTFTSSKLAELESWHATGEQSPLLAAMLKRLLYYGQSEITAFLNAENDDAARLGAWVRKNFETQRINQEVLLRSFEPDATPTIQDFYDAKLFEAVNDCSEIEAQLHFRMAYHDGAEAMTAFTRSGQKPPFSDVGLFLGRRLMLGWQPLQELDFGTFVGGYFYPRSQTELMILEQMQESLGRRAGHKMLREFLPELQKQTTETRYGGIALSMGAEVFLREVLAIKPGPTKKPTIDRLVNTLRDSSDSLYIELFGTIVETKLRVEDYILPSDSWSQAYLFGHKLLWTLPENTKTNLPLLLEILLGSLSPESDRDTAPAALAHGNHQRFIRVLRLLS